MNETKQSKKEKESYAPLSEDELRMLKASQEGEIDRSTLPPHDNSDMAKAKRYVKKNKLSVLFVLLTVIILAAVLFVLGFMLVSSLLNRPSTDDFTVILGDEDNKYTVKYEDAMIDDVFYLDIIKIAKYADIVVSGKEQRIKLMCEDGTYVRFEHGKNTATVNGTRVHLKGTAKITEATDKKDFECLVPYSFIEKLFSNPTVGDTPGVRTVFSSKDNKVQIGRVLYQSGTPLPISFSADCFDIAEEDSLLSYKATYPELTSICSKKTMLVNKNNPLGEGFTPQGLFSLNELGCPVVEDGDYLLISDAALSLCAMMNDLEKSIGKKDSVVVTSAYRSYSKQKGLFSTYVTELMEYKGYTREQAEAEVSKTAARAGYSEHQSGLCVDLIEKGKLELDESFEGCEAFAWLKDNAYRYGFILRYPKDKISITGYSYEPWHYRFVGIDAATVIYEDNLCLEEYLAKF